ncbi:hypothetical protein ALC53_01409 [Atta colombica]|uniref:Uncharacterized protein n=1 Tax=Atta colombica TaxID=520822 RepID=A0A195BUQ3_9HYME|nr:hypothetical protein ALC53_01409 [Atta colombica]
MAVRHYAHQYTMRLVDEKIIDGNVSENSDAEDYYPLIHYSTNGTMVSANARRQSKEVGWDKMMPERWEKCVTSNGAYFE